MFYLKYFFFLSKKFPLKSGMFFLFSLILSLVLQQHEYFPYFMEKYFPTKVPSPFFWALAEGGGDGQFWRSKILPLNGVEKVRIVAPRDLRQTLSQELRDTGMEIPQEFLDLPFTGIQVVLNPQVEKRSVNLIREYMAGLSGKNAITLGKVRWVKGMAGSQKEKTMRALRTWGLPVLVGLIFFIWCLFFYLLSSPFKQFSYLVERYQRRRHVGLKMVGSGLFFLLAFSVPISLWMGTPSLGGSLLCLLLFFLPSAIFHLKHGYEKNA